MPIHIPPLRKRKEEIPLLNERLIQKISQDYGRNVEGITPAALQQLIDYDWPGNVRELENILGRAIIFMNYNEQFIDVQHLPELKNKKNTKELFFSNSNDSVVIDRTLSDLMDEFEAKIIKQTLLRLNGNKTLTAKTLGLSVRNLYYKVEKYNIEKNSMQ
jgi:transcriptional regulator with PAS, ATPase and Fis domain